jgi:D-serine deaminase-like pyridoxal phosphate-dependent protein
VEAYLRATMALLAAQGIDCPVRTNGGSPDLFKAHLVPSSTEHRAGTYVYNDRSMVRAGECTNADLAMHVLATVISRPTPARAVLDSGSKALTSDLLGLTRRDRACPVPASPPCPKNMRWTISACGPRPGVGDGCRSSRTTPGHLEPL